MALLPEDFLDVADLVPNGAFHFINRAAVLRPRAAGRLTGFLFHDAFRLFSASFDFVLRARFHVPDSEFANAQAVNHLLQSREQQRDVDGKEDRNHHDECFVDEVAPRHGSNDCSADENGVKHHVQSLRQRAGEHEILC